MNSENIPVENINITKERLLAFCQKNKKYLLYFSIFAIMAILGLMIFFQLEKQKYIDISSNFYKIISSEEKSQNLKNLKQFYQENNSKKISSLFSLNYAKLLVSENKVDQAITIYQKISQNKSYDNFTKDFASFMQLKTMISYDYNKFNSEIKILLQNLNKKQNHHLKYYVFEQEAIFLFLTGNKDLSYQKFLKLVNPLNKDVAAEIKNRAQIMIKNHEDN
jgi:hypothetical protein